MTWHKSSFVTHLNASPSKKGRLGPKETATSHDSEEDAGKLEGVQKTQTQTPYFTWLTAKTHAFLFHVPLGPKALPLGHIWDPVSTHNMLAAAPCQWRII